MHPTPFIKLKKTTKTEEMLYCLLCCLLCCVCWFLLVCVVGELVEGTLMIATVDVCLLICWCCNDTRELLLILFSTIIMQAFLRKEFSESLVQSSK